MFDALVLGCLSHENMLLSEVGVVAFLLVLYQYTISMGTVLLSSSSPFHALKPVGYARLVIELHIYIEVFCDVTI